MVFFSGENTLKLIMVINTLTFLTQEGFLEVPHDLYKYIPENNPYSIDNGSIASILWSMFHHVDAAHLLSNMLGLYVYGWDVFVTTSSRSWNSIWVVLTIYLGSGMGASLGLVGLSHQLESQWTRRIRNNRLNAEMTCRGYWLCDSLHLSKVSTPFVDLYTHLAHADEVSALTLYRMAHRVGASGAVYGVMGARLYTSLFSVYHSSLCSNDMIFLTLSIAHEFRNSPIQLDNLWDMFVVGNNGGERVDHASHVFGLLSGILLAFLWHQILRCRGRRRWSNGGGRRLGTR
jgi:membrane associated rhomboid family serine protease